MKIAIDIGHPGHVHFFKNFIWEMEKRGHSIMVTSREKEISNYLLNKYKIGYKNLGKNKKGLLNKFIGIPVFDFKMFKAVKKFKPDIFLSIGSLYAAHVGKFLGKKVVTFTDTEHAKIANFMTFPFSDVICTPSFFLKDLGPKQVRYNGYQELTYLHPNWFKPDSGVLKEVGLNKKDNFSIVRFVSWEAAHDRGQTGFTSTDKIKIIKELEKYGKVFITSEISLPKNLENYKLKLSPEKIHDFLYYAQLYLGEGATMATESAILGTPSIFINSLVGTMGNFIELEKKYDLLYSFRNFSEALNKLKSVVEVKNIKKEWQKKREKMLKEKIDVTKWMINLIEKY